MSSDPTLSSTAKKNIETIAEVEQHLLRQRSWMERAGAAISRFFGSPHFIFAHIIFIAVWILWNAEVIAGFQPFDPYPFGLLALLVGIEFIFLTTFVLMNQQYQISHAEQWAHLDLQLTMLTEQEVTKNMQMLQTICQHLRLKKSAQDQEVKELTQATAVPALVDEMFKILELGQTPAEEIGNVEEAAEQTPEDERLAA